MVELQCPNDDCGKVWDYGGSKFHPTRVSCPDCGWKVRLPEWYTEEAQA